MDVIFFTLFRTDNPYSSISLSMAREMAKTHRVWYVNHPYSWKDVFGGWRKDPVLRARVRRLWRGEACYETLDSVPENFLSLTPPLTLPINWLPEGRLYDFLQGWNNRIVLGSIRRMIREKGIRDFVFVNCYDPFFVGSLPKEMGARCSVYHCIDDISQNEYTRRHGQRLEEEAMRQADLTLVTSTNLYDLKKPFARRIAHYFNAADTAVFARVRTERFEKPAELMGRSGKVIGFVGNLDELRIDYPLLKQVAERFPEHSLLLVGPLNSPEPAAIGLDKMPNVIFAGSRVLADLPPYLQYMDCVLIPFLCNTLTKSIYPLKINEYLAAGKAIVSTSFSADIRTFSEHIYLAENRELFLDQVALALAENDPEAVVSRGAVAQGNSWEVRVREFWELSVSVNE